MSVDSQTVSQDSRVAVIGVSQGLVGELRLTPGSIWKAAGLRLATWLITSSTTLRSTCRGVDAVHLVALCG